MRRWYVCAIGVGRCVDDTSVMMLTMCNYSMDNMCRSVHQYEYESLFIVAIYMCLREKLHCGLQAILGVVICLQ